MIKERKNRSDNVLKYYLDFVESKKRKPTLEEMANDLGIAKSGAKFHLVSLAKKKLIEPYDFGFRKAKPKPKKVLKKREKRVGRVFVEKSTLLFKYPSFLKPYIKASLTLNQIDALTQWFIKAATEKLEKEGFKLK